MICYQQKYRITATVCSKLMEDTEIRLEMTMQGDGLMVKTDDCS